MHLIRMFLDNFFHFIHFLLQILRNEDEDMSSTEMEAGGEPLISLSIFFKSRRSFYLNTSELKRGNNLTGELLSLKTQLTSKQDDLTRKWVTLFAHNFIEVKSQ